MKTSFPDYLDQHAERVPHMQTAFLLRAAAQELRRKEIVTNTNWYIKMSPNGDFEVVTDDD